MHDTQIFGERGEDGGPAPAVVPDAGLDRRRVALLLRASVLLIGVPVQ